MRYRRNTTRSLSGVIVILGLALAFAFGGFNLPIFFTALAFAALLGSLSTSNPKGVYGGLQGFCWMLGLAFCFLVGFWPWILFVVAASVLLGTQTQPIMNALIGMGLASPPPSQPSFNQAPYYQPQPGPPPEQYYQQQPAPPPVQPYQQGYQAPAPPRGTYQEGAGQYPYPPQAPPQYEQPQSQYPQQMPPQQG